MFSRAVTAGGEPSIDSRTWKKSMAWKNQGVMKSLSSIRLPMMK
jgi:hypothetical protein